MDRTIPTCSALRLASAVVAGILTLPAGAAAPSFPAERDMVQAVAIAKLAPAVEGDCPSCWSDMVAAWRVAPDTPGLAAAFLREAILRGDWRTADAVAVRSRDQGIDIGGMARLALVARLVERNDRAGLAALSDDAPDGNAIANALSRLLSLAMVADDRTIDSWPTGDAGRPTTTDRLMQAMVLTDRGDVDRAAATLDGVQGLAGGDLILFARLVATWQDKGHAKALETLSEPLRNSLSTLDFVRHAPALRMPDARHRIAMVLSNGLLGLQTVPGDTREVYLLRALLLQVALRVAPQDRLIALTLSDTLSALDRTDAALAVLPKSDAPEVVMRRAEVLIQQGRHDDARVALTGLSQPPLETRLRAVDAWRQLEDWGAVARVASVLRDDPAASPERLRPLRRALWLAEVEAWLALNDWPRARGTLERAVAADPDDPTVLNYAGYAALERRDDVPVAIARIEKAAKAAPGNASITDSLGWAYVVSGNTRRGVPLLEQAARSDGASAVIAEHLGDALWLTGRKIEAQQSWERARWAAETDKDRARIVRKLAQGFTTDTMAP